MSQTVCTYHHTGILFLEDQYRCVVLNLHSNTWNPYEYTRTFFLVVTEGVIAPEGYTSIPILCADHFIPSPMPINIKDRQLLLFV